MSPKKPVPTPRKKATEPPTPVKRRAALKAATKKSTRPPAPKAKNATSPTSGERMKPPKEGVKVRMYRTGLGDCFLLAFPRTATARDRRDVFYLLIDCGVYKGTPEPNNTTRIRKIVQDIRDATGGRLDLLVITHEHWDHVSAFHGSQAQSIFDQEIGLDQLWMAWTEDMGIPLAKDLHEGRKAARMALTYAVTKMQGINGSAETSALVQKTLDFFGGPVEGPVEGVSSSGPGLGAAGASVFAAKSVLTEQAMEWIKGTYGKGKTKFLHPGEGPLTFEGVPDARVYVLGPPEDSALIKMYNPSASGEEVYPKAMAAAIEASFFVAFGVVPKRRGDLPDRDDVKEACRMSIPFDEVYHISRKQEEDAYRAREENGKESTTTGSLFDSYFAESWRQIEGDWLESAGEFALQLDSATNNTSLAFALEIGPPGKGKVLLFPGDAQVGNWESWFGKVKVGKKEMGKDMVWSMNGGKVTAEDLLRRTVLYKVGHHGSHNATLRGKGLELMGSPDGSSELVALLPVDEHVARDLAHYGEMPLRSLIKDLAIRTGGRVARNDEGSQPKDAQSTLAPIPGAPALRSDFAVSNDLYFEYTVAPPR
jgi:hypothetical protein